MGLLFGTRLTAINGDFQKQMCNKKKLVHFYTASNNHAKYSAEHESFQPSTVTRAILTLIPSTSMLPIPTIALGRKSIVCFWRWWSTEKLISTLASEFWSITLGATWLPTNRKRNGINIGNGVCPNNERYDLSDATRQVYLWDNLDGEPAQSSHMLSSFNVNLFLRLFSFKWFVLRPKFKLITYSIDRKQQGLP